MPFFTVRGPVALATVAPITPVTRDAIGNMTQLSVGTTMDYTGMTVSSGATLLLAFISGRSIKDGLTAVWDPTGANQAMTALAETYTNGTNAGYCSVWGLVAPTSGNKTLRCTVTIGAFVFAAGCLSFNNSNAALASAVPSGKITTQNSGGAAVASQTDTVVADANTLGVVFNHCDNVNSNSASWSPAATSSLSGERSGFYYNTGTVSLQITPDIADACAGVSLEVSG